MLFQKGNKGEIRVIMGERHAERVVYRKHIEERIEEIQSSICAKFYSGRDYSSLNVDRLKKLIKVGKMILRYSSLDNIAESLNVKRATAMDYARCLIK